jgi:hypothetical protein
MDQKLMHTGKIQITDFWLKSDFLTKKAFVLRLTGCGLKMRAPDLHFW